MTQPKHRRRGARIKAQIARDEERTRLRQERAIKEACPDCGNYGCVHYIASLGDLSLTTI